MEQRVTVLFPEDDPFANAVLKEFLRKGSGRRPRSFEPDEEEWHGHIAYGTPSRKVPVQVLRAPANNVADWCISTSSRSVTLPTHKGRNHFTFSPWKIGHTRHTSRRHLIGFRLVPNMTAKNAANELAAAITRQAIDTGNFLAFPGGPEGQHQLHFEAWIKAQQPIQLISACCLHASEDRRGIAESLDADLIHLLARTAKACFANLPQVTSWHITTFGPDDYGWLGKLGIMKVLLPYMWNAPRDQVVADLEHNLAMTQELAALLDAALPFPVSCGQMHEGATAIDLDFLVHSSQDRARQMMPKLMETPPAIFSQLPTEEDRFARIQQEAFLYLYDTIRFGQRPDEDRPATLYVGLEVHGGYWQHGNLFVGPNREFLPLVWLPQVVRQHWASWTKKNRTITRERARIERALTYLGY